MIFDIDIDKRFFNVILKPNCASVDNVPGIGFIEKISKLDKIWLYRFLKIQIVNIGSFRYRDIDNGGNVLY